MEFSGFIRFFEELNSSTIISFVKEIEEMPERMKIVYERTKEFCKAEIRRISFEEAMKTTCVELTARKIIFIMNKFEGEAYTHLSNMDGIHLILGVPLLECLLELRNGESRELITKSNYRCVFNTAFNGITLCLSNIRSPEKMRIIRFLKFMNGKLTDKVDSTVTHLLTNTTKSVKYSEAAALNIPIYHYKWVESVWNKCLADSNRRIQADSEEFDTHRLPPFFGLKITSSRISCEQKAILETLIDENGGEYTEAYSTTDTDILLLNQKDTSNPKYLHAMKRKIPILNCSWVEESVKAGYSLPYEDFCLYTSKSRSSELFKKEDKDRRKEQKESLSDMPIFRTVSEHSDMPTIYNEENTEKSLDVSITIETDQQKLSTLSNNSLEDKEMEKKLILQFPVAELKKLDNFLDNYIFYLKDYPMNIIPKMRRIINRCGGSSVDSLNENFTHILCYSDADLRNLHKMMCDNNICAIPIFHRWIVDCLNEMKPLSEEKYVIDLSKEEKKGSSLRSIFLQRSTESKRSEHDLKESRRFRNTNLRMCMIKTELGINLAKRSHEEDDRSIQKSKRQRIDNQFTSSNYL